MSMEPTRTTELEMLRKEVKYQITELFWKQKQGDKLAYDNYIFLGYAEKGVNVNLKEEEVEQGEEKANVKKRGMVQIAYKVSKIDKAVEKICSLIEVGNHNIYISVGVFRHYSKSERKKMKIPLWKYTARKKELVISTAVIIIDLDLEKNIKCVNVEKEWERIKEENKDFFEKFKPDVVNSGHGIHLYFKLKDPVFFWHNDPQLRNPSTLRSWAKTCESLHKFFEKYYSDSVVANGKGRLIRVVGSDNCKGEPVRVYYIKKSLQRYGLTELYNYLAEKREKEQDDVVCEKVNRKETEQDKGKKTEKDFKKVEAGRKGGLSCKKKYINFLEGFGENKGWEINGYRHNFFFVLLPVTVREKEGKAREESLRAQIKKYNDRFITPLDNNEIEELIMSFMKTNYNRMKDKKIMQSFRLTQEECEKFNILTCDKTDFAKYKEQKNSRRRINYKVKREAEGSTKFQVRGKLIDRFLRKMLDVSLNADTWAFAYWVNVEMEYEDIFGTKEGACIGVGYLKRKKKVLADEGYVYEFVKKRLRYNKAYRVRRTDLECSKKQMEEANARLEADGMPRAIRNN